MNLGQIKTVPNSAKKHLAESDTYEAIYLEKNKEVDFYLFTEVELRKGLRRAMDQPEEEAQNPMSIDLSGAFWLLAGVVGFILGALIF